MENIQKRLSHIRLETDKTVTIIWNPYYQLFMFLCLILLLFGVYFDYSLIAIILALSAILAIIIQFIYTLIIVLPLFKEIKVATAGGKASVSGSKYSIKNPLTIVIQKNNKNNR